MDRLRNGPEMLAGLVFAEKLEYTGLRNAALSHFTPGFFLIIRFLAIPIISKTPGLSTASPLFFTSFQLLSVSGWARSTLKNG
jgi:hypothetical protein